MLLPLNNVEFRCTVLLLKVFVQNLIMKDWPWGMQFSESYRYDQISAFNSGDLMKQCTNRICFQLSSIHVKNLYSALD